VRVRERVPSHQIVLFAFGHHQERENEIYDERTETTEGTEGTATMSQAQDAIAMAEQEMAYRVELFNKSVCRHAPKNSCLTLTAFR
jgi:hypothetical protein